MNSMEKKNFVPIFIDVFIFILATAFLYYIGTLDIETSAKNMLYYIDFVLYFLFFMVLFYV